ncbi:hypothetical protein D5086_000600 [Populus alba]|uniref:Uncharacterized protein n=1 Tax=Populus alba TaxID=43335 RepID=A0ACC4CXG9_POPAL
MGLHRGLVGPPSLFLPLGFILLLASQAAANCPIITNPFHLDAGPLKLHVKTLFTHLSSGTAARELARDMGSGEIKSPEGLPETPATYDGVSNPIHSKKLGIHFLESDNRRMAFGRGYTGGTTPVNIHGKPIPDLSKTGGWIAALFIFGNEMAERMAYFGLSVNMVAFMFYIMHRPFTSSSNAVNNFLGISQASSVLGGFLADAYLGRYWTIAIFTTIYLAGLTGITLCATMNVFMPDQGQCDQLSLLLGNCEPAKPWQMLYLNTVLYVTGFGAAGIRPCVSSFGADQFDERGENYKSHLDRFFNFFYLSVTIGAIVAFTLVVYIQMKHGWGSAFGSLAIAMGMSNLLFFVGTPLYRHRLPGGSPLTRVAQVLVAAFQKRKASFSSSELVGLYEVPGKRSAIKGSGKIAHTDDFSLHNNAQSNLNRVSDSISTAGIYFEYTFGSSQTSSNKHARVSLPQYIPDIVSLLLAIFERYRRKYAIEHGYEFSFLTPMPNLRSAYAALAGGIGCFAASILNSIVKSVTGNPDKRQQSWLSQNINTGRFEYFYWLLTVLGAINFCAFLYSARRYKYRAEQKFGIQEVGALKILILHVRCVNDHGFQEMAYSLVIKLGGRANECQGPICLVGS